MDFNVILLIIILVLTGLFYTFYKKGKFGLSGPLNLPLVGALYLLNGDAPHKSLAKLSEKYGNIFALNLGTVYTVVISDAKLLQNLLVKQESIGKPPLYILKLLSTNKGIISPHDDIWKKQRKLLVDFLGMVGASKTSSNKKFLENILQEQSDDFIKSIKNYHDMKLNPKEFIGSYVSGVSSTLIFGKSYSRDKTILKNLTRNIQKQTGSMAFAGPLNFLPFLRFLPTYKKACEALQCAQKEVCKIQERLTKESKKTFWKSDDSDAPNLVHMFLKEQLKKDNSDEFEVEQLLADLVSDTVLASTETSNGSIMWTLLYLAAYQDTQDRVRQELNDVLNGKNFEINDIGKLPYMEATFAEISRIKTIAPLGSPHYTLDDVAIENYMIPKNTMIMPLLWRMHMNPIIWKEPERFYPERFLNEEGKFCAPNSYLPFQIGRRVCVGQDLARFLSFFFISNVLLHFKIEPCEKVTVDLNEICGVTLHPKPQLLKFSPIY